VNVDDVPAVIRGLVSHALPGCEGEWVLFRLPSLAPAVARTARIVLDCRVCGAISLYELTEVPADLGSATSQPEPILRLVRR
jgi:hypothetical protein